MATKLTLRPSVVLTLVLVYLINSTAADQGLISRLYKKASEKNRPIVLVLDNGQLKDKYYDKLGSSEVKSKSHKRLPYVYLQKQDQSSYEVSNSVKSRRPRDGYSNRPRSRYDRYRNRDHRHDDVSHDHKPSDLYGRLEEFLSKHRGRHRYHDDDRSDRDRSYGKRYRSRDQYRSWLRSEDKPVQDQDVKVDQQDKEREDRDRRDREERDRRDKEREDQERRDREDRDRRDKVREDQERRDREDRDRRDREDRDRRDREDQERRDREDQDRRDRDRQDRDRRDRVDQDRKPRVKSESAQAQIPVVKSLLRSLSCDALNECEDECGQNYNGRQKNQCENKCEQKFECEEEEDYQDPCEDCQSGGCGQPQCTGSTKGEILITEKPGCSRC